MDRKLYSFIHIYNEDLNALEFLLEYYKKYKCDFTLSQLV